MFLDSLLSDEVRYGVFSGMNFKPARGKANAYYGKLLGVYEKELAPILDGLSARSYELIINVGAAEGYYAVGLALAHSDAKVIAFETAEASRTTLSSLAGANGVSVDIYGFCDVAALSEVLAGRPRALVVFDIEGFEYDLLAPRVIDRLGSSDVLLETHEIFEVPGAQKIIDRFSSTHEIQVIRARRRRLTDLPFDLPGSFALRLGLFELLQEYRSYPQEWLWMQAKG